MKETTVNSTYEDVIIRNFRAARARCGMGQEALRQRMNELGYADWHRQTVSAIEHGQRRIPTGEILGIAIALNTSVFALLSPTPQDGSIHLPSGEVVPASAIGTAP